MQLQGVLRMVGEEDGPPIRYVVIDDEDELNVHDETVLPSAFAPVPCADSSVQHQQYNAPPMAHTSPYDHGIC
ncbi:unnamed protein product [Toxocara canis]|uniref:Uncharacterized protein n=1 Tax=Toxocara canis TaxID=6265 RepID=A0A183VGM2_TOXCA|nr:unnamed protein product [Toxocara canis]